jgi:hypothetical protein
MISIRSDFIDQWALADCVAQVFAKHCKDDYLRENPVRALRYLWRNADPDFRTTIACRVHVWKKGTAAGVCDRILPRDRNRFAANPSIKPLITEAQ